MVQSIKDMDELKTFLKAAGCKLVVVEFSAKWCGPCQRIYPLVHAMSLKYQNVMFANVDVDASQELAQIYHVKAVPTFQMFKQTQKVCFHGTKLLQTLTSLQIFEPINISPLCICEQIFEFCGADAQKLEAKIQELM
uniref:Thioredoxin domain containing 8 n=1 Tax=Canis lupus dingo TaxID=286419 RepID=A0A8C0LEJ2_CANLU